MELVVKGKQTEVTEPIRQYIERKIGKLDHYLDHITGAEVEVAEEQTKSLGDHFVVQVTVLVNGTILRAQEKDGNVRAAVDAAAHTMVKQINRFKGKLYSRSKPGATIREGELETSAFPGEDGEKAESGQFVKVKRFPIKPMYPDEAAEQMELIGHDFFLFLNAESGKYGVVYRRANGHYGLIEPE